MSVQSQGPESGIRLQCCGGNPVPQLVVDGWRSFTALPQGARDSIWELFAQTLLAPDHPDNERRLADYCSNHEVDREKVLDAVRSCDYLIRAACALNLSREIFEQDLALLATGESDAVTVIGSQFNSAKKELRKAIIEESLADHGNVLLGLDWRVDNVTASDRGTQLDSSIVLLTLRYRNADEVKRLSLQLTPDAMRQLKGFVGRFGGNLP